LSFVYSEVTPEDSASFIDCYIKKLDVFGVEISEDERKEASIISQDFTLLATQISSAFILVREICELELDDSMLKIIQTADLRYLLEIKIRINCAKFDLKQLEPDHEFVQNFELDSSWHNENCFNYSMLPYEDISKVYKDLQITKCTLDVFAFFQSEKFMIPFYQKLEVMLEGPETNRDETIKSMLEEFKNSYESKLKCLLDQIYDR
jgi:hypothetical protein